jgi:hypothetical protein
VSSYYRTTKLSDKITREFQRHQVIKEVEKIVKEIEYRDVEVETLVTTYASAYHYMCVPIQLSVTHLTLLCVRIEFEKIVTGTCLILLHVCA